MLSFLSHRSLPKIASKENRTAAITVDDIDIPYFGRFWLYLLFEIPSIICSIFVLAHLLLISSLRRALNNHLIIILLCLNLIVLLFDIPWILHYYDSGNVALPTHAFCIAWIFIDESLAITTTILFAWTTVERHILIFHDRLVSTRLRVLLIHYLPIVLLSVYCVCFSIVVITFPPCENVFDYTSVLCGHPLCYYNDPLVGIWDVMINHMLPTIVIIVSSATLFGRILYQKKRLRQPIRWRKHRKMAIQLLAISVLYLILYIPETLLEFFHFCGISRNVAAEFLVYADFFSYYIYLLFPFVCAGTLPSLQSKIRHVFPCWRRQRRAIVPDVSRVAETMRGHTIKESTTGF